VWRSLRRLGVPVSDLEDATQEVFLVVFRRWESYEDRSTPRAWLYAVCLRVCLTHRRRLRRRRELPSVEPPELSVEPTQVRHVELAEAMELGEELLALLPEKQRTVFLLYEVEHMTVAEIAESLGCPEQTAYARLRKARERVLAEVRRAQRRGRLL
jgi:RNA polymerase sigma-70 factor (ECF subfamily)